MDIRHYTVGELRNLIDSVIKDHQLELNAPVLIDDYTGNNQTEGRSRLCVCVEEGQLKLYCDFQGELSDEVIEKGKRILSELKV